MNDNLTKQNRFTEVCSMIIVVMIGLIFVVLSVASIMQTCRIDQANLYSEIINFDNDVIVLNLGLILLSALAFIVMMRQRFSLSALNTRFIITVMLAVTTVVSAAWVLMVRSVTGSDAAILLSTARDAALDQYGSFYKSYDYYANYSYYLFYPFQLGYVFFAEILYRIFGTGSSDMLFQVPNVIAVDFIYLGVVMITHRVFKRRAVTNMTAIALTVCLQPMFMTTFTYGILIGLAFSIWSVYYTIRYMQENKLLCAGIAAVLISLAVVFKYNNMIVLAALCIALILHTIGTKRFLALAAAAVMVIGGVGLQKLVILGYSQRSGVKLETQVSQVLFAYMGVGESKMAPGWYSGLAMFTLRDAALNSASGKLDQDAVKAADETAWKGIGERLSTLSKKGELVDYYKKKLFSQFNEPSFESVWISQVRKHDIPEGEELPSIVKSVYTGGFGTILDRWFNYYDMMIYIGFAAGMVFMILKRKANPVSVILPLTVLGGVLYHMLFEAKSQYILPYFIMLIPFAMYGLLEGAHLLKKKTGFLFRDQQGDGDAADSES